MPWLTTEEAAEILDYHPEYVRHLLRTDPLKGRKFGVVWFVDPDSVKGFKVRIEKQGFDKYDPRQESLKMKNEFLFR